MSDYYSYNDPKRAEQQRGTVDYNQSSGGGWIWPVVLIVALVGIVAIGATGRVAPSTETAPPVIPAPATATPSQTIDN
ncbi:hypothetical protein N9L47_08895 [Rhodobacteraceae bacterium]|nr:hypothetical protein [Paracoccaceae bacterium]